MSEKIEISAQVQIGEMQAHIQFLQNRVLLLSQIGNDALIKVDQLQKFIDANTETREIELNPE